MQRIKIDGVGESQVAPEEEAAFQETMFLLESLQFVCLVSTMECYCSNLMENDLFHFILHFILVVLHAIINATR